ncbi:MAG: O-antigen ligase family protein [Bacillota bacterium]|nr:O-antigen ligase family protein [Bacillota bacterium]
MKLYNKIMYFLMCIYIVSLPLFYDNIKIKKVPISGDIILALIIILYFIKVILFRDEKKKLVQYVSDFFHNPTTIFMFILLIMMSVSVSYAKDKSLAKKETIRFLSNILLFYIVKYDFKDKINKGIFNVFVILSMIVGIFGIVQFFTNIGLDKQFIGQYNFGVNKRIASSFGNPDTFGAFIILAIFPIIMLAIYEKNKFKKIILSLISVLLFINMILTGSRNAYLGFIIGCIILSILVSKKILIVLFGAGIPSLLIPQVRERILQIGSSTENASRIKIWKTALMMIKEHPIFGVGNGNFVSYYDDYTRKYKSLKILWHTKYPSHNSYLKVQSELGIIGIVAFFGTLVSGIINILKFVKTTDNKYYKYFYIGFLASVAAFYIMNLADNLFFVPKATTFFWLFLAICESFKFKNKVNH